MNKLSFGVPKLPSGLTQGMGVKVIVTSVIAGTVVIVILRRPLSKLLKFSRRKMATLEEHIRRRFGEGGRTAAFIKDFARGQDYLAPAKYAQRLRREFAPMAARIAKGNPLTRLEKREVLKRIIFLELTQLANEEQAQQLDWRPHLEGIPIYDCAVDLATGGTEEVRGLIETLWFFAEPTSRWSLKELGYQACHALLKPRTHPMQMGRFLNILTGDLSSSHDPTRGLALTGISKVLALAHFDSLSETIELESILLKWHDSARAIFVNKTAPYPTRRVAGRCLLEIYHHCPQYVNADPAFVHEITMHPDGGLGIAQVAVDLLLYATERGQDMPANAGFKALELLFKLRGLRSTPEMKVYTYFGVAAPWLQIGLLRLLGRSEPQQNAVAIVDRVLETVGTENVQNASALRIKTAIMIETVRVVLTWNQSPLQVSRALNHINHTLSHSLRLSRSNVVVICLKELAYLRLDINVEAVEQYARLKQPLIALLVEKTRTRHRLGSLPFLAMHRYYSIAVILHENQLHQQQEQQQQQQQQGVGFAQSVSPRPSPVLSLQELAERRILESLSLDNVCSVLKNAHSTNAGLLKTVCIDYIIANYDDYFADDIDTELRHEYGELEPTLRQEVGRMMMQLSHVAGTSGTDSAGM